MACLYSLVEFGLVKPEVHMMFLHGTCESNIDNWLKVSGNLVFAKKAWCTERKLFSSTEQAHDYMSRGAQMRPLTPLFFSPYTWWFLHISCCSCAFYWNSRKSTWLFCEESHTLWSRAGNIVPSLNLDVGHTLNLNLYFNVLWYSTLYTLQYMTLDIKSLDTPVVEDHQNCHDNCGFILVPPCCCFYLSKWSR